MGPGLFVGVVDVALIGVNTGPDVQLLGGRVALLQGAAALDAYRLMTEGITTVRRRDGIEPSPRLLLTVATLKAAALAAGSVSTAMAEVAEVRRDGVSRSSIRSGEVVGAGEVAHMLGVGVRQVRHLAPSLGGHRTTGRGRPWVFDRGLVQAYIDAEGIR